MMTMNKLMKYFYRWIGTHRGDTGDSLLEVMLSIAVLSTVAVGSMAVMNNGNALAQTALGRTEVRAMINTQTQLLQYARSDSGLWGAIKNVAYNGDETNATNYTARGASGGQSSRSFYLNNDGSVASSNNSEPVPFGRGNLWVDGICYSVAQKGQPYCDFYIKANWGGGNMPNHNITIVRLYG